MDKSQAVIEFISQCPQIQDNALFFNFLKAQDNNKQFVTVPNDKIMQRPYIDGSVSKRYTFTIIDYRSVIYQALVKDGSHPNENIEEYLDVQSILEWVEEQAENKNFPDFGSDCVIDSMRVLTDNPNLNGVDTSVTPPLAKYSMSIQIDYLDTSKMIWK